MCTGAFALSRAPSLRCAHLPLRTYVRVTVPIGLATMLDIGFSNWSLSYVSIAFHVILKGEILIIIIIRTTTITIITTTIIITIMCGVR